MNEQFLAQILLPYESGAAVLFQSIFNPDTCESLLDSVAMTNEDGIFGGWEPLEKHWDEHIVREIKLDLQAAICIANGHLRCVCPHVQK